MPLGVRAASCSLGYGIYKKPRYAIFFCLSLKAVTQSFKAWISCKMSPGGGASAFLPLDGSWASTTSQHFLKPAWNVSATDRAICPVGDRRDPPEPSHIKKKQVVPVILLAQGEEIQQLIAGLDR